MAVNTTKSVKERKTYSDADIDKMVKAVGKDLEKYPKVEIVIAEDGKDPVWKGWHNGYPIAFPKGKMVSLPEPIVEQIRHSAKLAYEAKQYEEKLVKGVEL
ncbi:MAG: hypothetical protein IIU73_00790 [Selenomonadales bacterium]|nr:hypothetical protein [Selenomonadales bacterium]